MEFPWHMYTCAYALAHMSTLSLFMIHDKTARQSRSPTQQLPWESMQATMEGRAILESLPGGLSTAAASATDVQMHSVTMEGYGSFRHALFFRGQGWVESKGMVIYRSRVGRDEMCTVEYRSMVCRDERGVRLDTTPGRYTGKKSDSSKEVDPSNNSWQLACMIRRNRGYSPLPSEDEAGSGIHRGAGVAGRMCH
jgi:hypothetical protein